MRDATTTPAAQASDTANRQAIADVAATTRPNRADTATISQASQAALAHETTSGTSPIQSSDGTYDFTHMTNAQLLTAAGALSANGSLSQSEAAQLSAKAQGVDDANPTNLEPWRRR